MSGKELAAKFGDRREADRDSLKERVDKSKKRREKKEAENEDYLATKKRRKVQ